MPAVPPVFLTDPCGVRDRVGVVQKPRQDLVAAAQMRGPVRGQVRVHALKGPVGADSGERGRDPGAFGPGIVRSSRGHEREAVPGRELREGIDAFGVARLGRDRGLDRDVVDPEPVGHFGKARIAFIPAARVQCPTKRAFAAAGEDLPVPGPRLVGECVEVVFRQVFLAAGELCLCDRR